MSSVKRKFETFNSTPSLRYTFFRVSLQDVFRRRRNHRDHFIAVRELRQSVSFQQQQQQKQQQQKQPIQVGDWSTEQQSRQHFHVAGQLVAWLRQ